MSMVQEVAHYGTHFEFSALRGTVSLRVRAFRALDQVGWRVRREVRLQKNEFTVFYKGSSMPQENTPKSGLALNCFKCNVNLFFKMLLNAVAVSLLPLVINVAHN